MSPHQSVLSKPGLAGPAGPPGRCGLSLPTSTSGFTSHREQSPKADVIAFFLVTLTQAQFLLHSGHHHTQEQEKATEAQEI